MEISALFSVPAYQAAVHLPASLNSGAATGRGVPDVSGEADPDTGYRVVVDDKVEAIGGAVAPLWAGLFALINAAAGEAVGQPHATSYDHLAAFNDVRHGNNHLGRFAAQPRRGGTPAQGSALPGAPPWRSCSWR